MTDWPTDRPTSKRTQGFIDKNNNNPEGPFLQQVCRFVGPPFIQICYIRTLVYSRGRRWRGRGLCRLCLTTWQPWVQGHFMFVSIKVDELCRHYSTTRQPWNDLKLKSVKVREICLTTWQCWQYMLCSKKLATLSVWKLWKYANFAWQLCNLHYKLATPDIFLPIDFVRQVGSPESMKVSERMI